MSMRIHSRMAFLALITSLVFAISSVGATPSEDALAKINRLAAGRTPSCVSERSKK